MIDGRGCWTEGGGRDVKEAPVNHEGHSQQIYRKVSVLLVSKVGTLLKRTRVNNPPLVLVKVYHGQ
jgi:hypothetical protein